MKTCLDPTTPRTELSALARAHVLVMPLYTCKRSYGSEVSKEKVS